MKNCFFFSIFFGLSLLSVSCARNVHDCEARDWYELGRRDGARGIHLNEQVSVPGACRSSLSAHDLEMYRNGWNFGISQFCSEPNGFIIGKENRSAQVQVCPEPLRNDFLRTYQSGREFFKINQELFEIEKELRKLQRQLASAQLEPTDRKKLRSRLSDLKRQHSSRMTR